MRLVPAIVENARQRHLQAVRDALTSMRAAGIEERKAETELATARQAAAERRLVFGRALVAARELWPERGPGSSGWKEFLGELYIDPTVALDAMRYAGYVECVGPLGDVPAHLPTMREAGIDKRPRHVDKRHRPETVIDDVSPTEEQRAACVFAADLLRRGEGGSLYPSATYSDAIAALERWATP